jgi:hypothetical protein
MLCHDTAATAGGVKSAYRWVDEALQAKIDAHFGKTLLFPAPSDGTDEQVTAAYRHPARCRQTRAARGVPGE